jgi:phosphoglycolate phosphatase
MGSPRPIDVHLMVKPVDRIVPDFAKAGATYITFHPEASEHVDRTLQLIRNEGCKAGLVFNPATPLSYLDYVMDKVDMILLMSVNPGFGGQSFIPATLEKLRQARKMIDDSGYDIRLEIDGGVKADNIAEIKAAGADTFVSGSGLFGYGKAEDPTAMTPLSARCARPSPALPAEVHGIMRPRMILIDLDGTLVDSVPDLAFCVDAMMARLGRPPHGEAAVRNWVGNGVERLVRRALVGQLNGEPEAADFAQAYPLFLELYRDNTSQRSCLYPGIREGLDWLKGNRYRLGCVTNKAAQFTEPLLRDLGVRDDFEIVISGDTLPRNKPDPLPLLHAAAHFGVDPAEALMIGDSVSDVKAARAAGFRIFCMSYGYNHGQDIRDFHPDAVMDSLVEVQGLLEGAA